MASPRMKNCAGLEEDEELRGLDDDEELRGLDEDEELRSFADDEELRGVAEDQDMQGHRQGLRAAGRHESCVEAFRAPVRAPRTRWHVRPRPSRPRRYGSSSGNHGSAATAATHLHLRALNTVRLTFSRLERDAGDTGRGNRR